jgi:hypothetical protein
MAESPTTTALAVYLFNDKTAEAVWTLSRLFNARLKQGVNESLPASGSACPSKFATSLGNSVQRHRKRELL